MTEEPQNAADQEPKSSGETGGKTRNLVFFLPLVLFVGLAGFLLNGLFHDPHELPSVLIGDPAPDFALPPIEGAPGLLGGLSKSDLVSDDPARVVLLNVFASWCGPCRVEHPVLMKIAEEGLPIYGLNYKDKAPAALKFLQDLGNPYQRVGFDESGRTGIDFGVYGVPETYVINARGEILFRHVGPMSRESFDRDVLPVVEAARAAAIENSAS